MGSRRSSADWIPDFEELEGLRTPPSPRLTFEEYLDFLESLGFWEARKEPPQIFEEEFRLDE